MKRVLFAIVALSFASPAMATDYVKCEAMNKAAARLRVSKQQEVKRVWNVYTDALEEACPASMAGGMDAWSACGRAFEAENKPQNDAMRAEVAAQYDERLAKVKADYEAEGFF